MERRQRNTLLLSFLLALIQGCAFFAHYDQVMLLKRMGDNRAEMEREVKKQEKLFARLKKDLSRKRLAPGMTQEKIFTLYGEPINCWPVKNEPGISQTCLFRRPAEFFSEDKIYLKFDREQKLRAWETQGAP
jgi:hypothetical protein